MISNPDGCAIIKIATQILTDLIIKIYMQNPRAILSNAIRGSLDDLQANYQYLAAMDPADRDKVLVDVNVELESVRDAINHPETQKAIRTPKFARAVELPGIDGAGFQPLTILHNATWGVAPGCNSSRLGRFEIWRVHEILFQGYVVRHIKRST